MSGTTPEQTETNAILAGGLAIVGLLGVAGTLLPPDMMPGGVPAAQALQSPAELPPAVTEPEGEAPAQAVVERSGVDSGAGDMPATTQQQTVIVAPAVKPVQRQASVPQSTATAVSAMMGASAEMLKVAGEVISSPASQPDTQPEPAANDAPPDSGTVQAPATPAAPVAQNAPAAAPAQNPPLAPAPVAPQPAPWVRWQPQPYPRPVYPQPYRPYPQWGAPQGTR